MSLLPEPTFFALFGRTCRPHWWTRWLHPDFQHCAVVKWDGIEYLLLEPSSELLDVRVVMEQIELTFEVVRIVRCRRFHVKPGLRVPHILSPFTCVEVCKAFLGVCSPLIVTPFQLYTHLVENLIEESEHGKADQAVTTAPAKPTDSNGTGPAGSGNTPATHTTH